MLAPLLFASLMITADSPPVSLCPENPRYLQLEGKPAILVTSGEHYGAVLNLDFDFVPYLDELASSGLNLTRTFAGTYREVPGSFKIENNTMAPTPNRYLAPWAKVADASADQPEKFDLDRFEPAYFERLKAFLSAADERGVVVELVLFCPNYSEDLWLVNPMNSRNNVNNVGDCPKDETYTLKHPELLKRQLAFTRKVVTELNAFDNLYYEICNEPYFGGVTLQWQERIAEEITRAEQELPQKHLIAQNVANEKAKVDKPVHPEVDILNFHYAAPAAALENLGLNLPIGDDETGFDGNDDRPYRQEAWHFLLSGGAIFNNLDYSFTPENEDGSAQVTAPTPGGGGPVLRKQLSDLRKFVESFDFVKMRPGGSDLVRSGVPEGGQFSALLEAGKQYALYLSVKEPGQTTFELELPAGSYTAEWFNPLTGESAGSIKFVHEGGPKSLESPHYKEDVALKIRAVSSP